MQTNRLVGQLQCSLRPPSHQQQRAHSIPHHGFSSQPAHPAGFLLSFFRHQPRTADQASLASFFVCDALTLFQVSRLDRVFCVMPRQCFFCVMPRQCFLCDASTVFFCVMPRQGFLCDASTVFFCVMPRQCLGVQAVLKYSCGSGRNLAWVPPASTMRTVLAMLVEWRKVR